jgi:hypothetical protein
MAALRGPAACVLLSVLALGSAPAQEAGGVPAVLYNGKVEGLPKGKQGSFLVSDPSLLSFRWNGGHWRVPYASIKTIYISLSRQPLAGAFIAGLPGAAVDAARRRKLLLSLVLDDAGKSSNCVFFLPEAAPQAFVRALTDRSGSTAIFESEEARKAVYKE